MKNKKEKFKRNLSRQLVKAKLKNALQKICIDKIEIDDDFKIKGDKVIGNFTNPKIHSIEIITLDFSTTKKGNEMYFLKIVFNDKMVPALRPIGDLTDLKLNDNFFKNLEKYLIDLSDS